MTEKIVAHAKSIARIIVKGLIGFLCFYTLQLQAQWLPLSKPGHAIHNVSNGPDVLAIAKNARVLAVGFTQDKSVGFYNPDTALLIGKVSLPGKSLAIALNGEGSRAYALYESGGIKIAVINIARQNIAATWSIGGNPVSMVLLETELLIADDKNDRLIAIAPDTGVVLRTRQLSQKPIMLSAGASSSVLFVAHKNGSLDLLDSSTLATKRSIAVASNIRSLSWWQGSNSAGRVLAVSQNNNQNTLSLIDPNAGSVTQVGLDNSANAIDVEQHNNWAYVGAENDKIISVIDLVDRTLAGHYAVPGKVGALLFDQKAGYLLVSLTLDNKLLKIDPDQAGLIQRVALPKAIQDITMGASNEGIAVGSQEAALTRINLLKQSVHMQVIPAKANKVAVDTSLNIAAIAGVDNKLTFINLDTSPASLYSERLDLGVGTQSMVSDPLRNITIVLPSSGEKLQVIDNALRTERANIPLPEKVSNFAFHSEKGIVYLATASKKIVSLDLEAQTVGQASNLDIEIGGIGIDPTLNRAVLIGRSQAQGQVRVLDLDSLEVVASITLPNIPTALAIQTDSHTAVIASKEGNSLALIDLQANTATTDFGEVENPTSLTISNRYNEVLVISDDTKQLTLIQLPNPAAVLSALSPETAAVQGATDAHDLTITLNGAHFIDGAIVMLGTQALATTWVSNETLQAVIPATLLRATGTHNIQVINPVPAGGRSAALPFIIGSVPTARFAAAAATAPGAPVIGTATAGNRQVTVTFTAPANDGGSAITSYTATCGARTATGPASPLTVTGLTNGVAVTCKVKATNSVGTGASSAASNSVTPRTTAPGAPTIGTATAGNAQVSVSFTAPGNNGGSAITGYTATCGAKSANRTSSPITVTGLTNGVAVSCTVVAKNAIGTGPASAASNSVTPNPPATVPGAPVIGIATGGNVSASVTFAAPASNGGSAITSYTATSSPGSKTGTCTAPCTAITVNTLTNGTSYTFTVKATNGVGTGAASAASNSVVPSTLISQTITGFAPATPVSYADGFFILSATGGGSGNPVIFATTTPLICSVTDNEVAIIKPGTCTLTANQTGNATYNAASQVTKNVVINKGSQTIDFPALPDVSIEVAKINVQAEASLTVTLVSTTSTTCTVANVNEVTLKATGVCTLQASQSGNTYWAAAPTISRSFTITPPLLLQTISNFNPASPVTFTPGATFTLSATGGASANPVIFGTVSSPVCTVTGNVVTMQSIGICTLTANQAGNVTYKPAAQQWAYVYIEPSANPTLPRLITPVLPDAARAPYSARLAIGGTPRASSVTVTGLPAGITTTYDSSGMLTFAGTPTVTGNFALTINATNTQGTAALPITLVVQPYANNVQSVSIGAMHACAVYNGGVRCWGYNNGEGQLGNNATTNSVFPVIAIAENSGATSVSVGYTHTCAVVNGGVQCWGNNDFGQLGNNSTSYSRVPTVIIPASSSVTAVSAGYAHTCAVVNGGVRCWGKNINGQLGNGSNTNSLLPVIAIADGSGATAVTAGGQHSCAVVSAGVKCWGGNSQKELGNGSTVASNVPVVTFPAGSGVTAISADVYTDVNAESRAHTCAVKAGGIACWGNPYNSQLGDDFSSQDIRYPIPTSRNATGVSVTYGKSCAIIGGGVECWGYDVSTNPMPGLSNVTTLALGIGKSGDVGCAITNGLVQCWDYDMLRGNSVQNSVYPTPVLTIPYASNATAVSMSGASTCATVAGQLQCWGDFGYLNRDVPVYVDKIVPIPTTITTGYSARYFDLHQSGERLCTLTDLGLECNGSDGNADGGVIRRDPTKWDWNLIPLPSGTSLASIALGYLHKCAVINGGAACWGYGGQGQLGNNATFDSYYSTVTAIPAGQGVTAVSAGSLHSCAVVNGGVQCWGQNDVGQLGNNSTVNSLIPVTTIPASSGVTAIVSVAHSNCAIVNTGVQCWGKNDDGQLGNNTTVNSLIPVTAIPAGSGVTALFGGGDYGDVRMCAVLNGGVQCWGAGLYVIYPQSAVPVQIVPANSGVASLAMGGGNFCVVIQGGVQCLGNNMYGQLGDGTLTNRPALVTAIPAGSNVLRVVTNGIYACALASGGILCWGNNEKGQLAQPHHQAQRVYVALANFTVPGSPTVTGSSSNSYSISINFASPASDGGSAITDYRAHCTREGTPWEYTSNTPAPAGTITVSVPANGTYTCNVVASNIVGTGAPSNSVTHMIGVPPSAPVITSNTLIAGGVTLHYTVPTTSGSGPITGYTARCTGGSLSTATGPANSTSINVTGLTTGQTYSCQVAAQSSSGTGAYSNSVSITVLAPPTVNVTAPASNAILIFMSSATINATATGKNGATISKIELYANDTIIGSSTNSASISMQWQPNMLGSIALTARATDSNGIVGVSPVVTVNVLAEPNVTITYLHTDLLGSTIAATDAAGNLLWKENYAPYGERQTNAAAASGNRQWFTGKPQDEETGLSYFGARYYDPRVGRFMGIDPVGFDEKNIHSFNRYGYANNNPYKFVDPDGRWPTISILPAHQNAIDRALSVLPEYDRQVLKNQQAIIDREQGNEVQYKHALRVPKESKEVAWGKADKFVRDEIDAARLYESAGLHTYALRHLGNAIHTMQDASSPAHGGFQEWNNDGPWINKALHGIKEGYDPGGMSKLDTVTSRAYILFKRAEPLPAHILEAP